MIMGLFRYAVYGLWFGLGLIGIMFIGEYISPGSLAKTAFTDAAIMSVFALLILDSMFSLGSAEE